MMCKFLAAAPLAFLALFAAWEANAQSKIVNNVTGHHLIVVFDVKGSESLGIPGTGSQIRLSLPPRAADGFETKGIVLTGMSVSGPVQCQLKSSRPGDRFEVFLNFFTQLIIEKGANGCLIQGRPW